MSPVAPGFKAMKARKLRTLLMRELGYTVTRQRGSHRQMDSPQHGRIVLAFHDGDEIGPAMVRDILVKQVGLTLERAKEVMRHA